MVTSLTKLYRNRGKPSDVTHKQSCIVTMVKPGEATHKQSCIVTVESLVTSLTKLHRNRGKPGDVTHKQSSKINRYVNCCTEEG